MSLNSLLELQDQRYHDWVCCEAFPKISKVIWIGRLVIRLESELLLNVYETSPSAESLTDYRLPPWNDPTRKRTYCVYFSNFVSRIYCVISVKRPDELHSHTPVQWQSNLPLKTLPQSLRADCLRDLIYLKVSTLFITMWSATIGRRSSVVINSNNRKHLTVIISGR